MAMFGITTMASSTAKPVALAAVALVLWFGAYWYWEPSNIRITYGLPPVPTVTPTAMLAVQDGGGILGSPIAAAAVDLQGKSPRGTELVSAPLGEEKSVSPKPRVVPPEFTTYTVQKGDVSFESIARRLGGGAKLAEAMKRANPFVPPNKLLVGRTQLRVPSDPENIDGRVKVDPPRAVAAAAENSASVQAPPTGSRWPMIEQSHTVVSGETLSGIAAKYYTGAMAWKKVFDANRDVMAAPEKLKVGTTLRIPPGP